MIYVSSSCVRSKNILDAVRYLALAGYQNIELSGGTAYVQDLENHLLALKNEFKLNLLCHNYFPPPKEEFVLNLASLDNNVFQKTVDHFQEAIKLSKSLGGRFFGLHAGHFMDISPGEIGRCIAFKKLYDRQMCLARFCDGYQKILKSAEGLTLYIENNVISAANIETFGHVNPLMLTSSEDYRELKKRINFKILLDVGHLKVSSRSLGLDFTAELRDLWPHTEYVHISDNDGFSDQNGAISETGDVFLLLKEYGVKGKTITFEIYKDEEGLRRSYALLEGLF